MIDWSSFFSETSHFLEVIAIVCLVACAPDEHKRGLYYLGFILMIWLAIAGFWGAVGMGDG